MNEVNNSNLSIQTHNFEEAKKGLKEFSENAPKKMSFTKVDNNKSVGQWILGGILGQGWSKAHNVTGEEFNTLTTQIQKHLIEINNMHLKFINEIGRVYVALEALDNDYIKAIVVSIKATEATSNGLKVAQDRIDEIVKNQSITLEVLKKHKQKLDEYSHLGDIDELWNQCQSFHSGIKELTEVVSQITSVVKEQSVEIESLTENLKAMDEESLLLKQTIEDISRKLQFVSTYVDELRTYDHLKDIDVIWEETEKQKLKMEYCEKRIEDIREFATTVKDSTNEKISVIETKHNNEVQKLYNKISLLYMIAGGALGIAIIELIIVLLK